MLRRRLEVPEVELSEALMEQAEAPTTGVLTLGNVSLDPDTYRVTVADDFVSLTVQEHDLLRIFLSRPNHVVSYNELTMRLWGNASRATTRRLNVLVHRLRGKIGASVPYLIETVRGRGYGFLLARDLPDEA